jgi:hypothetical protein
VERRLQQCWPRASALHGLGPHVSLENHMRRRGNPNWGKAYFLTPHRLTEFEQQAEELGLRPGEYAASPELRSWCLRNANIHYVPEYLLKLWGIKVNESRGLGSVVEWVAYGRFYDGYDKPTPRI